jgi:PAS domain S-box-containing protein
MVGLFEELANNAPVMIWRSRADKLCDFFNRPWLDFTGRTFGKEFSIGWEEGLHPDDHARCLEIYTNAFDAREKFSMEYRRRRHDGEYRWILDNGTPFIRDGVFAGYFGSCIDITERRQLDEGRLILIAELNHRVKNMLSTVQSLARQSCARAGTPREAEELLSGRLMALSQAHEVLAEQQWKGGEMGQVARRLAALATRAPERVQIEGSAVLLPPVLAQSIAMAFYELFLNALQYGALSNDTGIVGIVWKPAQHDGGTWLDIVWQERGGRASRKPRAGHSADPLHAAGGNCGQDGNQLSEGRRHLPDPHAVARRHDMTNAGRRVLIVEDEMFVAILLEDMLAELGHKVAGMAARVATAMPLLDTLDFDFAILDVNLAGEMSFPIADLLAEKGVPYLFSTGYGRPGIVAAHANRPVLSKPFSSDDLQSAIASALQEAA